MKLPSNLPRNFFKGPTPYEFQLQTFVWGITRRNAGLLLDLGLGKTMCAINIAKYRILEKSVSKVLVVAPLSMLEPWQREIKKWSDYKSIILHGKDREERKFRIGMNDFTFYLINYDATYLFMKELYAQKFDMLIADESARYLKTRSTNRTIAVAALAARANHRLILTGSPIANKPKDLWSQFYVLNQGKTFGDNYFKWQSYFFIKQDRGPWSEYVLNKSRIPILNKKIYESCIRFKKESVIDLPDKVFTEIPIPLTGPLEHVYNSASAQILQSIRTEDGRAHQLTINNILVKLLKLQQITGGFIKTDSGKTIELKQQPKLDALIEQIEIIVDNEEAVVVWCRFLKSIELIKKRLDKAGIKYVAVSGTGEDKKDRSKKMLSYQKGDIPVFIGQIMSGGIGVELFKIDSTAEAQYAIYYENVWNLDGRSQSINRIHRIGQNSKCVYIDIFLKGTIDQKIIGSIKEKKSVADMVIDMGVDKFLKIGA